MTTPLARPFTWLLSFLESFFIQLILSTHFSKPCSIQSDLSSHLWCLCDFSTHFSESVWLDYTSVSVCVKLTTYLSESVWLDCTPFCVRVKIDYTPFWAPASSMAAITVKADTDLLLTNRLDTKYSARFLMSLKFCSSSFIAHSMTRSHDARYRWLSSVFSSCCKPIDIHLYKYWKPYQNVKKNHMADKPITHYKFEAIYKRRTLF